MKLNQTGYEIPVINEGFPSSGPNVKHEFLNHLRIFKCFTKMTALFRQRPAWIVLSLFLFVLSPVGHAMIVGPVKIKGVVVSYNKKTVVLKSMGRQVRVPRSSIPKRFKLRTGKRVYALLEVEPLQSKMRKEAKPAKPARRVTRRVPVR